MNRKAPSFASVGHQESWEQVAAVLNRLRKSDLPRLSVEERLRLFDEATERQRRREARMKLPAELPTDRGWTREELYDRGKTR